MKEIIDVIVIGLFVFMLIMILRGFNKQQIQKHQDRLDKTQKDKNQEIDKKADKDE